jgi:hypothetical protein
MNNQRIEEKSGGSWWLYIGILALGLILGYTFGSDKGAKQPVSSGKTEPVMAVASSTPSTNVIVSDQNAGLLVLLDKVSLEGSGWVAIHEDNNGVLGNILGAQLFDAGIATNGTVSLLRTTEPGKTYYAVVYTDDGDRMFDRTKDVRLSKDGKEVLTTFKTIEKGLPIRNESSE